MPELPEVESFRKFFEKTSLSKKIKAVDSFGRKTLSKISPDELNKLLKGKSFTSAERHGKYLFVVVDSKITLAIHFGMTGEFSFVEENSELPGSVRARFIFTDGRQLLFHDYRMFGRIAITASKDDFIKDHKLGIDPINDKFSFEVFKNLVIKKKGLAKVVIMDQETIAGIGNLYSDEILFQSGIHPEAQLSKLDEEKLELIYRNTKKVLKDSIKYVEKNLDYPDDYLVNRRKKGEDCPVCGGEIKMKTIGGRSSYFCSKHQKK